MLSSPFKHAMLSGQKVNADNGYAIREIITCLITETGNWSVDELLASYWVCGHGRPLYTFLSLGIILLLKAAL